MSTVLERDYGAPPRVSNATASSPAIAEPYRATSLVSLGLAWLSTQSDLLLRGSLAIVFIWFGILKPFGLSPAADLVARTVFWFPSEYFVPILGWWEVAIGVGLLYRPWIRGALALLFLQMAGTLLPFVVLPGECFQTFPYALTLEGQYIVKNMVLISAAIAVAAHHLGGDAARR